MPATARSPSRSSPARSTRSRIGARSAAPLRDRRTEAPTPSLPRMRGREGPAPKAWEGGGSSERPERCGSGFVIGEAHGGGAGAVVGLDVDQRHHALVDLFLGAFEGRADVFRLLDILAVGAEALGHDVVAGVAEVAARLVVIRVRGPAAVEADDDEQRQFVAHRGVELHRVLAERAVAMQADDLLVGLGGLGADGKRQPDAHRAEGPRIEAMAGGERRDRLAPEIEDLLPVDAEDRVALLEVLDLLAEAQRMNVAVGRIVGADAGALRSLAVGQNLAPVGEALGGLGVDRVEQLLQD